MWPWKAPALSTPTSRGDARKLAGKLANSTDKLDVQSARLVAVDQGVNAVITGEISMRGNKYDVSAVAVDPVSGNVLAKRTSPSPTSRGF